MRQLASIQRITKLEPIEGKDRILLATVLGWTVIVAKEDNFNIGDLCIFVEPDVLLPERPEFEFLRKRCYSAKYGGFRIRTIRMAGTYSQGIVFPLSVLGWKGTVSYIAPGVDVTGIIGAKACEPDELQIKQQVKKHNWLWRLLYRLGLVRFKKTMMAFPKFAVKSDETRLQSIPEVLEHVAGEVCSVTEKIDGQSALFYLYNGKFGVCSRNVEILRQKKGGYDFGQYWEMAEKYRIEEKLRAFGFNLGIQCEIAGPGIQGNKLKLSERQIFVYQIQDLDTRSLLSHSLMILMCEMLNLPTVPILSVRITGPTSVSTWVDLSVHRSAINPDVWAEGIVVRTVQEKIVPGLPTVNSRCSFKVINPEFINEFD